MVRGTWERRRNNSTNGGEEKLLVVQRKMTTQFRFVNIVPFPGRSETDDCARKWARDRRNAENERDSDFGPEDYFDATLRGGYRGEEDEDEFAETMLLVALCLAVAVLIYIRTRLVERARREQEGQPGQQPPQNLGMFPPPDHPARQDWQIWR